MMLLNISQILVYNHVLHCNLAFAQAQHLIPLVWCDTLLNSVCSVSETIQFLEANSQR